MMAPSRLLSELLTDGPHLPPGADRAVSDLTLDSRAVQPGALFLALPGATVDGRAYIGAALAAGAAAVLEEAEQRGVRYADNGTPIIGMPQLSSRLGQLAGRFFFEPSRRLSLIGVTGTNGKTTTSQLIARVMGRLGRPCAVMGTLGYGMPDALTESANTTPDAVRVQRFLAEQVAAGVTAAVMEVSSHGLELGRVADLSFTSAVFTNLTQDHLDLHGDMPSYFQAKRKLFVWPELSAAIINADDAYGHQLLGDPEVRATKYAYGTSQAAHASGTLPTIFAERPSFTERGVSARLHTPWGEAELSSNLLGAFNLSNLLAVVATLGAFGHPLARIVSELAAPLAVPGRMERYGGGDKPLAVVDYAHTPDALEQALKVLRVHCAGRLWCVFGCGGDRDRSKRPQMGAIAEHYADRVLLTNDNPRTESAEQIIADIQDGLLRPERVRVQTDRALAIAQAIKEAEPGDIVLVAGKGHEDYQLIGKERLSFSDAEVVRMSLGVNG